MTVIDCPNIAGAKAPIAPVLNIFHFVFFPEYMHLIGKKIYLKCAVFDITFGQIATMNSVVKSECRNMRCGEATLLAQEFFHRGVYY